MTETTCQGCGNNTEEFADRFESLPDGTIIRCERCPKVA